MGRSMAIYWPFNGHFHMRLGTRSSRRDVQGICASSVHGIWYRRQLPRSDTVSKSTLSELLDKIIPGEKFQKLMEKFKFYLNPVHFLILFFDFKVRLKWDK